MLKWSQEFFTKHGFEDARLEAEVLLAYALHMDRFHLYVNFERVLNTDDLAAYKELIKKRVAHYPSAYIVGQKAFMNLYFNVTKDVLIPRPETEILVQTVMDNLKLINDESIRIADIGTGSGAIAISLIKSFRGAVVVDAVDISEAAIEVAKQNADKHQVSDKINFYVGDLLEPIADKKFTAIVSNPPYIPDKVIDTLQPEVAKYEPRLALSGGADGLDFYRRLVKDAPDLITDPGFLALEIGINQSKAVTKMIEDDGRLNSIEVIKDLAGIDRIIIAWKNKPEVINNEYYYEQD